MFSSLVQGGVSNPVSHSSLISFTVIFPSNHTDFLVTPKTWVAALEAEVSLAGRGMLSDLCKAPWSLVSCFCFLAYPAINWKFWGFLSLTQQHWGWGGGTLPLYFQAEKALC